jgi:hypothetical protein
MPISNRSMNRTLCAVSGAASALLALAGCGGAPPGAAQRIAAATASAQSSSNACSTSVQCGRLIRWGWSTGVAQ